MESSGIVFLDRDGTVNFDPGYINDPDMFSLLPGAAEGLGKLKNLGLDLYVISNQSGLGRGLITERQLEAVTDRFKDLLQADGVTLNGIYYCPHTPDKGCLCRKPNTALLESILARYDHDMPRYFVGDKECDVLAGLNCGCEVVYIDYGAADSETKSFINRIGSDRLHTVHRVSDLLEAAAFIESDLRAGKQ